MFVINPMPPQLLPGLLQRIAAGEALGDISGATARIEAASREQT